MPPDVPPQQWPAQSNVADPPHVPAQSRLCPGEHPPVPEHMVLVGVAVTEWVPLLIRVHVKDGPVKATENTLVKVPIKNRTG